MGARVTCIIRRQLGMSRLVNDICSPGEAPRFGRDCFANVFFKFKIQIKKTIVTQYHAHTRNAKKGIVSRYSFNAYQALRQLGTGYIYINMTVVQRNYKVLQYNINHIKAFTKIP